MKNLLIRDWLILVVLFIPFPFIMFAWDTFPERIPIHFNLQGTPDRYSGKAFGLLIFPAINIVLYAILQAVPMIDPKRNNFQFFEGRYRIIRTVIHVLLAFAFFLIAMFSLGYSFDITKVITYALVLMLLILGNYMSSVRLNYSVGIRTPWTLNNETVWKKTHRFTAKLWVFSSIALLVALPFISAALIVFLVFVGMITIIPIVYSYVVFRTINKTEQGLPKAH
jgi:uncharacterized membrane protein